jgi:hypothetical protein
MLAFDVMCYTTTTTTTDVVEALTYYGHREKLRLVGKEDALEQLNLAALRIAKEVADETGTLFAGNICNCKYCSLLLVSSCYSFYSLLGQLSYIFFFFFDCYLFSQSVGGEGPERGGHGERT